MIYGASHIDSQVAKRCWLNKRNSGLVHNEVGVNRTKTLGQPMVV